MSNERLPEEPCHYHSGLNAGSCIEKIYTKDVSRRKREIFICSGRATEIQLLRNEIRLRSERRENLSLVREEAVISSIVRSSLSFVGCKEKPTNESIEACQNFVGKTT